MPTKFVGIERPPKEPFLGYACVLHYHLWVEFQHTFVMEDPSRRCHSKRSWQYIKNHFVGVINARWKVDGMSFICSLPWYLRFTDGGVTFYMWHHPCPSFRFSIGLRGKCSLYCSEKMCYCERNNIWIPELLPSVRLACLSSVEDFPRSLDSFELSDARNLSQQEWDFLWRAKSPGAILHRFHKNCSHEKFRCRISTNDQSREAVCVSLNYDNQVHFDIDSQTFLGFIYIIQRSLSEIDNQESPKWVKVVYFPYVLTMQWHRKEQCSCTCVTVRPAGAFSKSRGDRIKLLLPEVSHKVEPSVQGEECTDNVPRLHSWDNILQCRSRTCGAISALTSRI